MWPGPEQAERLTQQEAPGRARRFLRPLGPGLITAAADDSSAITTYWHGGAAFGTILLWGR